MEEEELEKEEEEELEEATEAVGLEEEAGAGEANTKAE